MCSNIFDKVSAISGQFEKLKIEITLTELNERALVTRIKC